MLFGFYGPRYSSLYSKCVPETSREFDICYFASAGEELLPLGKFVPNFVPIATFFPARPQSYNAGDGNMARSLSRDSAPQQKSGPLALEKKTWISHPLHGKS